MNPALNTVFSIGYTLMMSSRALRWSALGKDPRVYTTLSVEWSRTLCSRCGVEVRVVGLEGIDLERPFVLVANHQSYFDIPVLIAGTGRLFRFLAKRELFSVPLFGAAIRGAGTVPIDRGNSASARASVDRAALVVAQGASVVVFPEGTRSRNGRMRAFKKGAFFLAQRAKVPVLPVAIVGTGRVLPKGSLLVRPGVVEVRFGAPRSCRDDSDAAREELRMGAREEIAALLGQEPFAAAARRSGLSSTG